MLNLLFNLGRTAKYLPDCCISSSVLWGLRPSLFLVLSSIADILIISTLAVCGIAMAPLAISIMAFEFAAAIVFGLLMNLAKIPLFARLCIS